MLHHTKTETEANPTVPTAINAVEPTSTATTETAVENETEQLAELEAAVQQRHRSFNIANTASLMTVAGSLIGAATLVRIMLQNPEVYPVSMALLGTTYCLGMGVTLGWSWRGKRKMETVIASLDEQASIRAIGPLLRAMEMSDPRKDFALLGRSDRAASTEATRLLKRLLPSLRTEDKEWLTSQERQAMVRALLLCAYKRYSWRSDPELAVLLLNALQALGETAAIPQVRQIAASSPFPEVKSAAQSCQETLESLVREQQTPKTLLRPSVEPGSAREELLRASIGAGQTAPAELLRPSEETNG